MFDRKSQPILKDQKVTF